MTALFRKLLRDLWQMKGQAIAIAAVVTAGVAVYIASLAALDSLELSRAAYYERYRFADVFARMRRAPLSLVDRVATIPGVMQAEGRVVTDVTLDMPGMTDPAAGRIISIPELHGPKLNDIFLREGRYIEGGRDDEVLVSEAFMNAHKLAIGDSITAVINGKRRSLSVVGIALSPEYVYQIGAGSFLPDDKRFAILWMGREALAAALDMRGAMNDISLTLTRGASEAAVIDEVDKLIAPYGGLGTHGRSLQVSDQFLSSELDQLRTTAFIIPSIFLGVAAFLLNVVLARLIGTQRTQIATLKAFGYSNFQIGIHYLQFAMLIVLVGSIAGAFAGLWLGRGMTRLYAEYYRFPVLTLRITPSTAVASILVSIAAAVVGVVASVRSAAKLPPAEAMRPEPPAKFEPTWIERMGIHKLLSQAGRMILRNVARRPGRAIFSIVGIAFAVAILVVGRFSEDATMYMADLQFRTVQTEDAMVVFTNPARGNATTSLEKLPGVLRAEPFRAAPVTLRNGHLEKRTTIMGLTKTGDLRRLVDKHMNRAEVPPEGIVLTTYLGELLGLKAGDKVTVEALDGRRTTHDVSVVLLLDELIGASGYMELGALNRLLEEGDTISGAFLAVDDAKSEELYRELKRTPVVAAVASREAVLTNFNKTMEENLGTMRSFQIVFAAIIALSIVYNNARIALAERSRELASLRVLGFSRAEVSVLLLGELAIVTLAAIPVGLGIGHFLAWSITAGFQMEMFRMPFVVYGSTYAYATIVVLIAATASALIVRRSVDKLDLVGVLKTRD
ncbi:MAG: FtsX-like permease family protein [Polyangiaceae bacterium]|nr:FtsX-like permease family protein [Polyangiaceae bacterium]